MTSSELFLRLLAAIRPTAPYILAVFAATATLLVIMALRIKKLSLSTRSMRRLGILFGLKPGGCLALASAWLKFAFLTVFLLSVNPLEKTDYLAFLLPGIVHAALAGGTKSVFSKLLWLVLELAAILSTNIVCSYVHSIGGGFIYTAAYICMSVFSVMFAFYLFLTEVHEISDRRTHYAD